MTLTVICLSSLKASTSITWFSFLIASHLPPFLHIPISLLYVRWIYSLSFFFLLLTGFVLLLLCDYQASQTGVKYEWKWLNKDFLFRKKCVFSGVWWFLQRKRHSKSYPSHLWAKHFKLAKQLHKWELETDRNKKISCSSKHNDAFILVTLWGQFLHF